LAKKLLDSTVDENLRREGASWEKGGVHQREVDRL
jgi:hypothetical protein